MRLHILIFFFFCYSLQESVYDVSLNVSHFETVALHKCMMCQIDNFEI